MSSGEAANDKQDPHAQLRWGIYTLLIALSVGNMLGRLMTVGSNHAPAFPG